MEFQCPSCTQHIGIDDAELAGLTVETEFSCPGCGASILLQPERKAPAPLRPGQRRPAAPRRTSASAETKKLHPSAGQVHRRLNRNLLILGSAALLVLGGIGFFLASRNAGDKHIKKTEISNEIIHNKFFTDLIASGAATEKDLLAIRSILPHGDGFIGVSKDKLTWREAEELAMNTGAEILPVGETADGKADADPMADLAKAFPGAPGETSWVRSGGGPMMADIPDLLPVTTLGRPRHAFFRWSPGNLYLKNRNWMRLGKTEPRLPHVFDADSKFDWLYVWIQYNNAGSEPLRLSARPYYKGKAFGGSDGLISIQPGAGEVKRGVVLQQAGEIDQLRIQVWAASGPTKDEDAISTTQIPLHAVWKSAKDVELISIKAPAVLSATKDITIPAKVGERFTVSLTARYSTPRPTKLASNLLMEEANILPPEFLAELKANHETTWHFDTESRPGYGSANGRGTITYDLTGYAPKAAGTYHFDFNLGLFDKNTWATEVLKVHKVTLNVTAP